MFHRNYTISKDFIRLMKELYVKEGYITEYLDEFLQTRFNLNTYFNVLQIECTEKYQADLEKIYDQTNDQLTPMSHLTLTTALSLLTNPTIYLAEIGDKLIKLSLQLIVRHLTWVTDKISERGGGKMATERVLYIVEDLS